MQVFDVIPPPGLSIGGQTKGPAVSLGRSRVGRGQPLWLHESELREAAKAFGWPRPEQHAETATRVAELEQANATLTAENSRLVGEHAAMVTALSVVQPKAKTEPVAVDEARKPAAKKPKA